MYILGINGSHRAGKGTSLLLRAALDAAVGAGAQTELVELSALDIGYCAGCNACLARTTCALSDDMDALVEKMRSADGILLGSPVYFGNVTARMKTFIDRTRPLHMAENALAGKVGGAVVTAGLPDCGAEGTLAVLDAFFATHEMIAVHPRPAGPVLRGGVIATQLAGFSEGGRPCWQSTKDDQVALKFAAQLGRDVAGLIARA